MIHPAFPERPMPSLAPRDTNYAFGNTFGCGMAMDLTTPEGSLLEIQLTKLLLQSRLKAQARMSNVLYEQQRQHHPAFFANQYPRQTLVSGRFGTSKLDDNVLVTKQTYRDQSETGTMSSRSSPSLDEHEHERLYVDTIRDTDILCGRGGRTNHHPGNKRYRHVISEMKLAYRSTVGKSNKTDLSRAIVNHVCTYGGRFLKREESTGRYYILTTNEARRKTSQALREAKVLKWTTSRR